MRKAITIQEVISFLEEIIETEVNASSTAAYFPVLYKQVTERIAKGIVRGEFDDNERMERLDVIFANRYLEAYQLWKNGETPSLSWLHAFQATGGTHSIILQHLLLGINAHINLDLGIAAAETMVGKPLKDIEADYDTINSILASMIDEVQERISEVSPLFYLLEKVAKGKEDAVASFSIEVAREGAWLFANEYHHVTDKAGAIARRDQRIASLAQRLARPKRRWVRWVIKVVRWFENKEVGAVAAILNE